MNLFEIYDAAIENAQMNDLVFDAKAVQEYADVVFDVHVTNENANTIMRAHQNWLDSDKGSHNFDTLVKFELQAIEI